MDDQFKTTSTSPDSSFSEFSSHDSIINSGSGPTSSTISIINSGSGPTSSAISIINSGSGPTSSTISIISPNRSSNTLANMSNNTDTLAFQNLSFDEYNSQQSTSMCPWQLDAEDLNPKFSSSNQQPLLAPAYRINDSLTNQNLASWSTPDILFSPVPRLSTSSSLMSFNNITNPKPISQRSSRLPMTSSTDQLNVPNENDNPFTSASLFLPLPLPTPSSDRQTLSAIGNISSTITDNDLQRVPPSFMIMQSSSSSSSSSYGNTPMVHSHPQAQPQVVYSASRSNSMPSWRGYLPMKFEPITLDQYQITAHFSQKVFLGGIPPGLTEAELLLVLRNFGKCNIKWPKNDGINHNMPGFCHVIFRESRSVCELLKHCTRQQRSTIDYFLHIHMSPSSSTTTTTTTTTLPIRTHRLKPIQVVPWNVKDNVFVMQHESVSNGETSYKDWSRTIFVSPLHGKMTGFSLATIMSNVFGRVSMAQINTDKYGYPTVLFCDSHSYMRAVAAGAIDIKCDCFHKLLDIDPFLRENEPCAFCPSVADLFCRNFHCLRSYCKQCWVNRHGVQPLADHQPVTRRQQPLPHV